MNTVEEIERVMEQLSQSDLEKLAAWIDRRRHTVQRDHSAFLNSYAPSDEGLYDEATARGDLAG